MGDPVPQTPRIRLLSCLLSMMRSNNGGPVKTSQEAKVFFLSIEAILMFVSQVAVVDFTVSLVLFLTWFANS